MKKILIVMSVLAAFSAAAFAKSSKNDKTIGQVLDETIEQIQANAEETKGKAKEKGADLKKKAEKQGKKAKKELKKANKQIKKAAKDIKDIFSED